MAESDWDNDFDAVLDAAVADIEAALPAALAKGAEYLRAEAVKLTPVETGNLAGEAEVRGAALDWEVYYPGPYARRQHYELSYRHTHGQALFLEQPTITEAPKVIQIIADDVRDAL